MRKPSGIGLCPQSPHYDIVNPSGDNQNSREITKRLAKMISGDVVTNIDVGVIWNEYNLNHPSMQWFVPHSPQCGICQYSGLVIWQISPSHPQEWSLCRSGWPSLCLRVLFSLTMQPRKTDPIHNGYILYFYHLQLLPLQNDGIARPSCSSPATHPLHTLLYPERLLLIGCCIYKVVDR